MSLDRLQNSRETINSMVEHVKIVAESIKDEEILKLLEAIEKAKRIFIVGVGKTGLIAKTFAMSLLSIDKEAYVVGESLMPAPAEPDLIIAVSGSGESNYTIKAARLGKQFGSNVLVITSNLSSTLGKLGDITIHIPGREEGIEEKDHLKRLVGGGHLSVKGALFELGIVLLLNSISTVLQNQ